MRAEGLDVSTLFNARKRREAPAGDAIEIDIRQPRLGSATIHDLGDSLGLWLSVGGSMTVPKSGVRVLNRSANVMELDWNGEEIEVAFAGTIVAFRAERVITGSPDE